MSLFDPYKKLAQIIDNMNARSAEGEESGVSQISAPLSYAELLRRCQDAERRNAYLEQEILNSDASLRRLNADFSNLQHRFELLSDLYDAAIESNDDNQDIIVEGGSWRIH